jgi:hypothetical protein
VAGQLAAASLEITRPPNRDSHWPLTQPLNRPRSSHCPSMAMFYEYVITVRSAKSL